MNLILINLKEHNHNKLKEISKNFDWNTEALLSFKDNNIIKIWVDLDTKDVVAYQTNKDSNLYLGDDFIEKLSSMKSFQLPKKPKVFNLDSILEKISIKGINSLNSDEKNYLDNLNK
jgi:hypothetical protein